MPLIQQGHASQNDMEAARAVFDSLQDPPAGVAAAGNHLVDRHPQRHASAPAPALDAPVYREPSSWDIMVRSELGAGENQRAAELLQRVEDRCYPEAGALVLLGFPSLVRSTVQELTKFFFVSQS